MTGELRTTYVGAIGSSVDVSDDVAIGVIRADYDFVDRACDRNLPKLGPPTRLLDAYKQVEESAERDGHPDAERVAWEAVNFRSRYLSHLDDKPKAVGAIRRSVEGGRDVWLVCLEKEDTFCHRRLLAARVRGEEPAEWRELHEPVEPEPDDRDDGPKQIGLTNWEGSA